jgi:hypothetical protein
LTEPERSYLLDHINQHLGGKPITFPLAQDLALQIRRQVELRNRDMIMYDMMSQVAPQLLSDKISTAKVDKATTGSSSQTAASSASRQSAAKPHRSEKDGRYYAFFCTKHGANPSHGTADCRVLKEQASRGASAHAALQAGTATALVAATSSLPPPPIQAQQRPKTVHFADQASRRKPAMPGANRPCYGCGGTDHVLQHCQTETGKRMQAERLAAYRDNRPWYPPASATALTAPMVSSGSSGIPQASAHPGLGYNTNLGVTIPPPAFLNTDTPLPAPFMYGGTLEPADGSDDLAAIIQLQPLEVSGDCTACVRHQQAMPRGFRQLPPTATPGVVPPASPLPEGSMEPVARALAAAGGQLSLAGSLLRGIQEQQDTAARRRAPALEAAVEQMVTMAAAPLAASCRQAQLS